MASNQLLVASAACAVTAARHSLVKQIAPAVRSFATASSSAHPATSPAHNHKVVVVGGGSAGLTISHQLMRKGKFSQDDIAVVDPAEWHHYQPGWTLVGGGLKDKTALRRPLSSLIDPKLRFYNTSLSQFSPDANTVALGNGTTLTYDQLIVAPGIALNYDGIKGLKAALEDSHAPVSTIYGYDTCDKTFDNIKALTGGQALFTQPVGVVKCAGAPQKIMWLALDHWKRAGLYNPSDPSGSSINISFATGLPTMFGVPKYSAALEKLRVARGVEGLFSHDLVEVDGNTAIFTHAPSGDRVARHFDFLHATPKMGPHAFVKNSPLANEAGFVDVDDATLRHKKWKNVWSAGDASSLPTSKTAAAITAQAPVLVENVLRDLEGKSAGDESRYDGYTSCPLLTQYGKVLLAEFKYAGEPKETFAGVLGDQATPRRVFYHLKKDFFPWVYYKYMVKGQWGGPKGWIR